MSSDATEDDDDADAPRLLAWPAAPAPPAMPPPPRSARTAASVSLPPRGDEAVLFNASVPHDVAPSHAERWALTMWVHGAL